MDSAPFQGSDRESVRGHQRIPLAATGGGFARRDGTCGALKSTLGYSWPLASPTCGKASMVYHSWLSRNWGGRHSVETCSCFAVCHERERSVLGTVSEMRVGPSEPPFRRWFQTTQCSSDRKPWWWAIGRKNQLTFYFHVVACRNSCPQTSHNDSLSGREDR